MMGTCKLLHGHIEKQYKDLFVDHKETQSAHYTICRVCEK